MTISRRRFIVATTFVAAGLATGTAALGAEGDMIEISIAEPRALKGLSGDALRSALVKSVRLRARLTGPVKAQFLAGRVENGALQEVFASDAFALKPGTVALPGDMFFPGQMFFTGDMFFPGDMLLPGDTFLPGDMFVPRYGASRLLEPVVRDTLRRGDEASGLVFFVLVDAKGARGRGLGVPTRRG